MGRGEPAAIVDLLAILADEWVGTVAGVTAHNGSGEAMELELLLLPLSATRPSLARTIGVLAPLKIPQWLGASPIGALTLGSRRHIGAAVEKRLLPRFLTPRSRRGSRLRRRALVILTPANLAPTNCPPAYRLRPQCGFAR